MTDTVQIGEAVIVLTSNIEKLLAILERELEVFDRGDRPDYEVIRAVISYFEVYPEVYHHPQEDLVFAKLRTRDPVAAAKVGDLAREHHKGAERLRSVAHAVENVLADAEVLRQDVDTIERWLKWALAEADRIDPVKTARFLEGIETGDSPK